MEIAVPNSLVVLKFNSDGSVSSERRKLSLRERLYSEFKDWTSSDFDDVEQSLNEAMGKYKQTATRLKKSLQSIRKIVLG